MPKSFATTEIAKMLRADGWYIDRQNGSHQQWKHPTRNGRVTLQAKRKDIPVGTLRSIFEMAGWEWPPQ